MQKIIFLIVVFGLFVSGCGISSEQPQIRDLQLSFDGSSCTFEGPEELSSGPISLTFYNNSDTLASMNFMWHSSGKSVQDMIDYLGDDPSTIHKPDWVQDLYTWERVLPGNSITLNLDLEEGIYTILCARRIPFAVWFGTGLEVYE